MSQKNNKIYSHSNYSLQSKFILDTGKLKYEKIKLEEFKYQNRSNLSPSIARPSHQKTSPEDLVHFLVKKVDYSTESQLKYSLLNRFAISLNQSANSQQNLTVSCESANMYLHVDFIKNFLHSKFFNSIVDSYVNGPTAKRPVNLFSKLYHASDTNDTPLVFNFRMLHSYVHLIYLPDNVRSGFSGVGTQVIGLTKVN